MRSTSEIEIIASSGLPEITSRSAAMEIPRLYLALRRNFFCIAPWDARPAKAFWTARS